MMIVYNTMSGKKEELVTLNTHKVGMYVCGPTTYNYIHLGNARPLVVFDTVRRYLSYRGYEVTYVQNFTDVDDKIINRAREEGTDALALGAKYVEEYFKDADALNIQRADIHPRVSQHIPEIIAAVQGLIEKEYAYEVDGDVYYRVRAFSEYGKLSGRTLDDMLAGARIEVDERKEEAADFALWKAAKPGEPAWNSPWGQGRPGWHIECSVMSTRYLGDTFDIHGGGSDLIFPHHENEIAQAEALTGKTFVNYWLHNGFITVNDEKMSKSLGNFFLLRDILEKYPADVVRFYLIATHYRSPLDFDDGKLEEARKALGRLKTTLMLAEEFSGVNPIDGPNHNRTGLQQIETIEKLKQDFINAMDDDFNTARAMGYLFEISHEINSYIAAADKNDTEQQNIVKNAAFCLYKLGNILGIFFKTSRAGAVLTERVLQLFAELRRQARDAKNYALADIIRDLFKEQGIAIEDTPEGSRVRYEQEPALEPLLEKLLEMRTDFKQNKNYTQADYIRDELQKIGIIIEDTREGARWKIANA